MLRDVVGNFLSSLTEREFDAPLLALLARRGFYDIHFIHGSFEFGKDVIAKHTCPETGKVLQYAIQSKAGDIGLSAWREVRPQLEESGYNTRAHPNYDSSLARVAVLVTTGRLKGAAATDAQEYKESIESRGELKIEFWDYLTLTEWLSEDPESGHTGRLNHHLLGVVSRATAGKLREADLEKYTRRWIGTGGESSAGLELACIEAAIISNIFRINFRLDLAAAVALHLFRATESAEAGPNSLLSSSALRLFGSYAAELLLQTEPLLDDRYALARSTAGPFSIVTYPVVTMRLLEMFSLLALISKTEDVELATRARAAVYNLAAKHPGAARPLSDDFAVSMLVPMYILHARNPSLCKRYLHAAAQWVLDRSDPQLGGLGLGASGDSEEAVVERLLGGFLESTKITRRRQSLVAAAILDLTRLLGFRELHDSLRNDLDALDIQPFNLLVSAERAKWRRGGEGVGAPQALQLGTRYRSVRGSPEYDIDSRGIYALVLMSVSRSWYRFDVLASVFGYRETHFYND